MILKLTLLLVAASLAEFALRRASAALRHFVWMLAFHGALLLPVLGFYAPRLAGGAFAIHTSAVGGVWNAPARFNWVLAIYVGGVLLCLLRLALDILATNRIVRDSRVSSVRRVLISEEAKVPFAWDFIVVPPGYETRVSVVAHEAAHLERGDVANFLLANLVCAIYWFHPLIWWANYRMRLEADRACDDAVLRQGFGEADYAGELVAVAKSFKAPRLAPAAVETSQLELRLRHILAIRVNREKLSMPLAAAAALIFIAVALPLAVLSQPVARIFKVGKGVSAPSVLYKVDPSYTKEAQAAKVQGTVLLALVIGTDGRAHDVQVRKSVNPQLSAQAIDAVRKWKFKPGIKGGQPVNVQASIEVNFRLL